MTFHNNVNKRACSKCGRAISVTNMSKHVPACKPIVTYYYRGIQERSPVYSRKDEQPYMRRQDCYADARKDGKRARFSNDDS